MAARLPPCCKIHHFKYKIHHLKYKIPRFEYEFPSSLKNILIFTHSIFSSPSPRSWTYLFRPRNTSQNRPQNRPPQKARDYRPENGPKQRPIYGLCKVRAFPGEGTALWCPWLLLGHRSAPAIRERSINRRHVYTQQRERGLSIAGMYIHSREVYQSPACICTAERSINRRHVYTQQRGPSIAGMHIQTRQALNTYHAVVAPRPDESNTLLHNRVAARICKVHHFNAKFLVFNTQFLVCNTKFFVSNTNFLIFTHQADATTPCPLILKIIMFNENNHHHV